MTQLLVKTIADFSTTLTTKTAVGATSATLTSGLDSDGVQLPTGTYGFTIDRNNAQKEHFTATLTGDALTSIKTVTRGTGVGTSGLVNTHRKGAEVIISDHVAIKRMMNVLDGTTSFDSATPLGYDGAPTISTGNQFATKTYADGLAIAGSPDATTSTKGITTMSVAPASAATPIAVGDNDGRVPTQGENDSLVGNNTDIAVGSGNKMVTQTGLQHGAEKYAADAGANDTYVITLSPVPTSYTAGMVLHFKANTANTGAATLNVNSLGAKTIKKGVSTTLVDGDILAGQFVTVIYDGTDFILQNPTGTNAAPLLFKNGTAQHDISTTGAQTIAHGLGIIPKFVKISVMYSSSSAGSVSNGSYNGTTTSCVYYLNNAASSSHANSSTFILFVGSATGTMETATIAVDATNITLTWSKTGSPTGTAEIMWEALA